MARKAGTKVEVFGLQSVIRAFEKMAHGGVQKTVREALLEVGEAVLARAIQYCPMDTGALRASGRVVVTDQGNHWSTLRLQVVFGGKVGWVPPGGWGQGGSSRWTRDRAYGGPEDLIGKVVYYAVYVHERTDVVQWTTPGTGPKFLERAVREILPEAGRIAGRRMEELIGATDSPFRFGRLTIT